LTDFTLASFNCHWGVGRFRHHHAQPYDVARLIESWDADIVVVPEVVRDYDGASLLDPLVDAGYTIESVRLMDLQKRRDRSRVRDLVPRMGYWELGVATRFPIKGRREIVMGSFNTDPVGTRRALSLTLDIERTAVELIAVHTSSKFYVGTPMRQLNALKRQLEAGGPQIIAGDFNFWGPPVGMLMSEWKRPVRGRTYPGHRPHSQIDHVLVRGGIEPLSGEVLAETPSDHRPVRARLRLLP
jgi:endonuclease/exonuclease/phosphatase family metal-dependent hydrolase